MTDSSGSFMDGHGMVQTRHTLSGTLIDIVSLAGAVGAMIGPVAPMYGAAAEIAGKIESLASGLVQELTLLRDKEGK